MSPNDPPDPCQEPPVHINIVTAARGLDAGGYTFTYLATWAGGDPAPVRDAAEAVTTAARAILARLDTDTRPGDQRCGRPASAA